jgi:hypothetical protein
MIDIALSINSINNYSPTYQLQPIFVHITQMGLIYILQQINEIISLKYPDI